MILAGLDIGQVVDYMALVLIGVQDVRPPVYVVRFVYRWPLQLSNVAMMVDIKRILANIKDTVYLNVDYTGKGAVFGEFMERAFQSPPRLTNVITDYSVFTKAMKENLVSNTKLLLGEKRLLFPKPEAGTYKEMLDLLFEELCNYRVRIYESAVRGKPTSELGALGYGEHDDLATALFLALEDAEYTQASGEMYWIRH